MATINRAENGTKVSQMQIRAPGKVIAIVNWRASSEPFDSGGDFIFTVPIGPDIPALFYLPQLQ
jgi:hypothetical protein